MKEALWVLGALLVMVLLGVARAVPFLDLIAAGQSVMLYGAAFGVPFEIVYFTALGVSLGGQRPVGWYWRPFVHHHLLTKSQRVVVLPFYALGALSFAVATLGIATVVIAVTSVSVAD
jgi:hypothetical protein